MRPVVLQLTPLMRSVQSVLDDEYEVIAWPEDQPGQDALIASRGSEIEVATTSGHHGIDTALAKRLPKLKLVAINGVGFDRVDIDAMKALGVAVTNTPDVLTDDVADVAIGLMINAMRRLPAAERHVREGHWPKRDPKLARTASGRRYGILGLGRIGLAIAARLGGFGGTISYSSRTRKDVAHAYYPDARSLAEASDVLFIANAANASTRGMIDRTVLDALGPDGIIINVARGAIIDEPALVAALVEGRLGGAGLDVFTDEPHVPTELLTLENVALAPHVGSATHETREAMGRLMLDNVAAHAAGRPLLTPVE